MTVFLSYLLIMIVFFNYLLIMGCFLELIVSNDRNQQGLYKSEGISYFRFFFLLNSFHLSISDILCFTVLLCILCISFFFSFVIVFEQRRRLGKKALLGILLMFFRFFFDQWILPCISLLVIFMILLLIHYINFLSLLLSLHHLP